MEQEAQDTKEQAQAEAGATDDLSKKVEYLTNALKAEQDKRRSLEEKAKEHNAEMVRKKEREREALEKEQKALEEKGEYAKAMELLKKQLDEASKFKAEADLIRKQADSERRRYRVIEALRGKIDPKVPVERAVTFVDVGAVEFDESGNLKDADRFVSDFLKREQWLQPPVGGKIGAPPPPAGTGAASPLTKEAHIVAKNWGLPLEVIQGMDDATIKRMLESMPQPEQNYSELFS